MTKVQLSFKLSRPLSDEDLKQVSRVHAVFGILAVRVPATSGELFVEYDASRLSVPDVKGILDKHGLPLQ
jgi:hypothetical protein